MTQADRLYLWIARWALRRMSNRAAWRWYMTLRAAYNARPDLAGEDVPARRGID